MRIKRILALLICVIITISALPSVGFAEGGTFSVNKEKIDLLTYLGIVEYPMDDSLFDVEVTRADFAVYVANIVGITEKDECDKRYYTDLPEDHWAYNTINTMTQKGYLHGTDGRFNPEGSITYQQAIAMLLNTLGYGDIIASRGGWPNGYAAVAQELDIAARGSGQTGEITFAVACEILHDTLLAPVLEYAKLTANETSVVMSSDKTVMGKYFNVHRVTGVVNSTFGISVDTKNPCGVNTIRIDDSEYDCIVTDAVDFLGKKVYAYYEEDDMEQTVFLIASKNENDCFVLDIADFHSYDPATFTITYRDEGTARLKKEKIAANASVIRNGENYSANVAQAFQGLNFGSIQLSSSQGSGVNDIVIIKNYTDMVVSSFDKSFEKIYDKMLPAAVLDLSSLENYRVLDNEGKPMNISNIDKGSVLSICRSSKYCEIRVSGMVHSGSIESIDDGDTDMYTHVVLDGVDVPVDTAYYNANTLLFKPRTSIKIYVNAFGVGIYAEVGANDDFAIGWVIKAKESYEGETICNITMLTQAGKVEKLMCADKVVSGGTRLLDGAAIEAVLGGSPVIGQLVQYKLDEDGRIKRLETVSGTTPSSPSDLYQVGSTISSAHYYSTNMMMGPTIKLTPSTICFSIPADSTDIKGYSVLTASQLAGDKAYSYVTAYKTTDTTHTAEVLVIRENTAGSWGRQMYLVDKVYDVLDEDDETITAIDVYVNGSQRTMYEGSGYSFAANGVESGDVWIFWLNDKGEITTGSREIYDISTGVANDHGHAFTWEPYIGFGYITSIKEGVAKYGCTMTGAGIPQYDPNEANWTKSALLPTVGAPVVIYDSFEKTVEFGEESNLYEAMRAQNKIFVTQTFGSVNSIIIIK